MLLKTTFLGPLGLLIATATGAQAAHAHVAARHNVSIPMDQRSAAEVVAQLNLVPNDEKGYYVQTFEDPDQVIRTGSDNGTRSASTEIYYLLEGAAGSSYWHRVDAVEVWHYYAGAPLTLSLSNDDGAAPVERLLGPDVFDGQQPQVAIPKGTWQSALSHGRWTLVGTTVAPGFVPDGVELAPPGWEPNGA
ncbi:RmlC-like cupin domain-containing protein [Hypoxylon rubiginosum]|uniref:RmlC-like cupin domain-containing protein n=1 Tax=Hypoxylon rubiginosum TaxID=110542 RepID=A0ACB9YRM0_9PEZI|nr:RmlC-like cupin domain-containing protein [Hypoxylon rubiginosum]